MILAIAAIVIGLAVLVWSADRFVEGASATAFHAGVSPLLIGMLIVGFGTSAPEMVVSAFAAVEGNPGLALGNGFGSNITNIGLVLGITALVSPIVVQSNILRKELPVLLAVTLFAGWQLLDGELSRNDAFILLGLLFGLIAISVIAAMRSNGDKLAEEVDHEIEGQDMPLSNAVFWLLVGLALLVVSSRVLVWGAISVAQTLGVSDLIIGLTVVALGTSLPELAASIAAARKGEHDIALGNVIGSNMFNLLAVVGIAGTIQPLEVAATVLQRDWMVMFGLTVALALMCIGIRSRGQINRLEGLLLVIAYLSYNAWLGYEVVNTTAAG